MHTTNKIRYFKSKELKNNLVKQRLNGMHKYMHCIMKHLKDSCALC